MTLGAPLHRLRTTTSTNDEAKRGARSGAPHGATWVAEEQTAGRGRQGRSWVSPRGENLLFSVLLRVDCVPSRLPLVAIVAGLAVRDAVARAASRADVRIKWPNDVLVASKTIAGILVEAITVGRRIEAVVVGAGVNVHTRIFPDDLSDRATSLSLVSTEPRDPKCSTPLPSGVRSRGPECSTPLPSGVRSHDRDELLGRILEGIDHDLHVVLARGLGIVRARVDAADALRGKRVRCDSGDAGVASGIDDEGRLLVRRGDGVVTRWSAGEVHLVTGG
jgi:BirA family biotin operon repressor/biotin-[acetyl-CoA-carboxylase] ligase